MNFFGYSIIRQKKEDEGKQESVQTFVEDANQDGSFDLSTNGFVSYGINSDAAPKDEILLISKYREIAAQPEIEKAIDDIINEAFSYDEDVVPVELNMENCTNISEAVQKQIRGEFDNILKMLNFKNDCYEIFRRWYVDGRLYYHKVIDTKDPKKGIKELRNIDPRKIKKVRDEVKRKSKKFVSGTEVNKKYYEFYIYNPNGIQTTHPEGLKIAPDSITYVHSGILDITNTVVLSHLQESIKPFNQLRMMEDSVVIYRLARASEKRVFNVEIPPMLPKQKAEQFMQETMNRMTKKIQYDVTTGEVQDRRRFMSMLDDLWFAKRDGKGTTVDVLAEGGNLGQMDDVQYFKKKLYEALKVPVSRLESSQNFNLGRASEITRDELRFGKFISRLRKRFSYLFENILGDQLVIKGVLTLKEWEEMKQELSFDFLEDNFFTEFKWSEIWNQRITTFEAVSPLIGKFVSRNWVRKNILQISEEEWDELLDEMTKENEENPLVDESGNPIGANGNLDIQKKPSPKKIENADKAEEKEDRITWEME